MSHFFISYKREDADFAELLKNNIKDAGFAVWMDRDGLEAGENWSETNFFPLTTQTTMMHGRLP